VRKTNRHDFVKNDRVDTDRRVNYGLRKLQRDPATNAAAIAERVGLSVSRFQHLFKKSVGVSVRAYSLELKLEKAAYLLRTTFKTVKEIRNKVGISDSSNFSRHFRRRFEISPTEFQKRNSRFYQQKAESTNTKQLRRLRAVTSTFSR